MTDNNNMYLPEGTLDILKEDTKQRTIAIVGPPKSWKSNLAATAPKKLNYFIDPLNRLESLKKQLVTKQIEGVVGKTYLDSPYPDESTAWDALYYDVNQFINEHRSHRVIPGTFTVDDIDAVMDRAMRKYLVDNKNNEKTVRKMTLGGSTYLYPNDWTAYTVSSNMVGIMIAGLMETGSDVIAIFHEREEEAEDSTPKNRKYTGKKTVHPPRAAAFLPMFNEYWHMSQNGKAYQVQTKTGYDFDGATCMELDEVEEPNISDMIHKHNERTKKNAESHIRTETSN